MRLLTLCFQLAFKHQLNEPMFYSALIAINNDKDIFGQTELCISSARTALLNVFILKSVDEIF